MISVESTPRVWSDRIAAIRARDIHFKRHRLINQARGERERYLGRGFVVAAGFRDRDRVCSNEDGSTSSWKIPHRVLPLHPYRRQTTEEVTLASQHPKLAEIRRAT